MKVRPVLRPTKIIFAGSSLLVHVELINISLDVHRNSCNSILIWAKTYWETIVNNVIFELWFPFQEISDEVQCWFCIRNPECISLKRPNDLYISYIMITFCRNHFHLHSICSICTSLSWYIDHFHTWSQNHTAGSSQCSYKAGGRWAVQCRHRTWVLRHPRWPHQAARADTESQ